MIHERWCAFVNYSEEQSAAAALEALQVIYSWEALKSNLNPILAFSEYDIKNCLISGVDPGFQSIVISLHHKVINYLIVACAVLFLHENCPVQQSACCMLCF